MGEISEKASIMNWFAENGGGDLLYITNGKAKDYISKLIDIIYIKSVPNIDKLREIENILNDFSVIIGDICTIINGKELFEKETNDKIKAEIYITKAYVSFLETLQYIAFSRYKIFYNAAYFSGALINDAFIK